MKKINLNTLLPYLLCVVFFYVVAIAYFKPEFFDGKSLFQNDIVQYEGASKEVRDFNDKSEEKSLWTGAMFSGMPMYLIHSDYPDRAVAIIDWTFKGIFFRDKNAHQLLVTLMATFFALVCFGAKPWAAAIGAVAFGLSTYNLIIIEVGHMTKSWAIAYAPLVLAGIYLAFKKDKLLQGIALFTLAMSLELRANHLQITYYLGFIAVFYGISELIFTLKNKENIGNFAKIVAFLLLGAVLAVGTSAGRILTTLEYGKYSQRGPAELTPMDKEAQGSGDGLDRDYAYNWSQGKIETLTLLVPNLYGGSNGEKLGKNTATYQLLEGAASNGQFPQDDFRQFVSNAPMYWGDQPFTSAPVYAGAIVCFLFVLGLILLENRYRYWLLAATIFMFMISWGKNLEWFNFTMFDYFPAFNKFRSVSMALSLAVMLMVITAILGLKKLSDLPLDEASFLPIFKKVLIAFGATGGLALVLWLMAGSFSFASPNDENLGGLLESVLADRKAMLRSDALRTFFFIALSVGAIYFFLKKKISFQIATLIIGLLMTIDAWAVGKRYLSEDDFSKSRRTSIHQATPADEKILQDKDLSYRVMNLTRNPFEDAETSYFHKSIGGYFAAKLRRYQDLIERQLSPQMQVMVGDLQKGTPQFANYGVINMLNTRYIKVSNDASGVIRNPNAYGNAWFVSSISEVKSADEEIKILGALPLDSIAVIDVSKFPISKKQFAKGNEIKMTSYQPNKVEYEYSADSEAFVVFSEIYYPEGWSATIDGQPAKFVRTNYVLRGMEVPKGKHKIAFSFESSAYKTGSLLTMISSVLVLLLSIGVVGFSVWKENK